MSKRNLLLLTIVSLLLASSLACALTELVARAPAEAPTPTRTPKPTFTPTPVETPTPEIFPTATPLPPTPTPELPPTFTPEPATPTPEPPTPTPEPPIPTPPPMAIAQQDKVNVRTGPSTAYPIVGQATQAMPLEILGKNAAGDWWQVCCVGNQQGWITGQLVRVQGDTSGVPVVASVPPPPPTATRQPVPTATPAPPPPTAAPQFPFVLVRGVEKCEPNKAMTYFSGFVRYRNNTLRNGVCVHIAFYGPRGTKCSGCDGAGDGIWGFTPFGPAPAPPGTTVEIFVVTCPASMPIGGQGEQTGFGDLTPQSEKWIYTVNESVQCTGITFAGG